MSGFRNIDISRKSGGLCHKFNVGVGERRLDCRMVCAVERRWTKVWSRRTGLVKEGSGGSGGSVEKRSFTAELGERKEVPERDRVGENPGRREPGGRSGQRKREREREARPGEGSLRNRASGGRAPEKRERSGGERDGRVGVRQTEENRRRKGEDERHRGQRVRNS